MELCPKPKDLRKSKARRCKRKAEQTGLETSIPLRQLGDHSEFRFRPLALRPRFSTSLPFRVGYLAFDFQRNDNARDWIAQ
jgi:hypothetical protein